MRYLIECFIRFKGFVGNKIYYLLALMLVVGLVEGVGVMLFLPILQDGFGSDGFSRILKFVFDFFRIPFSFTRILAFILIFFVLRAVFLLLYARYFGKIFSNLLISLRRDISNKIFAADYLYILKKEIGYINNAMTREVRCLIDAFQKFSTTLSYAIYGFVYVTLALILDFKVVIAVILISGICYILMKKFNLHIAQVSRDSSFSHGKLHSILIQALSKIKYLKATLSNTSISKIIDRRNKKLGYLQFRLFFLQALSKNVFETFIILMVVAILFSYVIVLGKDVNEVMFLALLFLMVAKQFLSALAAYRQFLASMGSIETCNTFIKELDENREDLNLKGLPPDFSNEIILRDVTVVFPNGKKALDDVNVRIRPKAIVAFVGHSGSGKSTIANMVTGILKPTGGEILFGDVDYSRLNLKTLREKIGYVTQEDIIFNASITENISLWGEKIDENKLASVIEMAHITGFVNDLPERQDSMLGDDGLDISGGQRQRITIARELYKNAKLLILDEATSSLDSKSEKQIYENLKEFKGKKTMVVIAHRLSTIKNADYIYVVEDGRVVEEGTYEELYSRKGEFTNMVKEQTLT